MRGLQSTFSPGKVFDKPLMKSFSSRTRGNRGREFPLVEPGRIGGNALVGNLGEGTTCRGEETGGEKKKKTLGGTGSLLGEGW